jgi:hypothetical protein
LSKATNKFPLLGRGLGGGQLEEGRTFCVPKDLCRIIIKVLNRVPPPWEGARGGQLEEGRSFCVEYCYAVGILDSGTKFPSSDEEGNESRRLVGRKGSLKAPAFGFCPIIPVLEPGLAFFKPRQNEFVGLASVPCRAVRDTSLYPKGGAVNMHTIKFRYTKKEIFKIKLSNERSIYTWYKRLSRGFLRLYSKKWCGYSGFGGGTV